ncbi:23S rRNA methyltransferase [Hypericibacter terrae]|uniref:23S rRNA methyltransferase n=1 Tax=Hypericibacter terrae TaxID=2602015 RepID=A0A5J6MM85_9PROT|nr:23S rRNA (uracil(1939)-C(5))-methyltransferase RlmD [Hypericibacter terrae]QEX18628.1 23S rRNA methyltransferase [Hypericibacter terrae]
MPRPGPRPKRVNLAPRQAEIAIERIGGQGDGIGHFEGRPVYVPATVPGDRLSVRLAAAKGDGLAGEAIELLESGPARVEPPCPYFGRCGGCALQQLRDDAYAEWKGQLLADALVRRGLKDVELRPLLRVAPGLRRRARFALGTRGKGLALGFNMRDSHAIADIEHCLLLVPALDRLIAPLRSGLEELLAPGGHAALEATATETGIDLLIEQTGAPPSAAIRVRLGALAEELDLARVSWGRPGEAPEPIAMRRAPSESFGGVAVALPPGAFLQPSREGEALLLAEARAALKGAKQIADLFAGCGSFSLPLSQGARIHAVEGDKAATEALQAAVRRANIAHRLTVERRDLDRAPLQPIELKRFDALLFDPPRNGAKAQAECLAKSDLPLVVAVSCSVASFARDAQILVNGGYRLDWARPVDQFPWSAHLEIVARFSR